MTEQLDNWKTASLSELVVDPRDDIVDGPFGSRLKASEYVDAGVPIVRLQNIDRNRFIEKNIKFVTKKKASEIARHHFIAGDILISKLGDPLGEACIAPASIPYGILVADVVRVRPNNQKIDTAFLALALNSTPVIAQFEAETKGTTRPRVNLQKIRDLQIPILKDLDDQRAIVAEIEKQFTRLDTGVAGLRRVQANLKRYRAAILKAACEGKLVPTEAELARQEGRSYETGAQLLKRILAERRQKRNRKGKYKEPAKPGTADLLLLPEGWGWASLDQICVKITDGEHLSPKTVSGGVFLLSAKDVRENGVLFNDPKFVSSKDAEQFRKRCDPDLGDVLVVSRGATIGRISVVQTAETFCLMGSVILLKSDKNVWGRFLASCLRDRRAKERLGILSGSTAQQAIYIRDMRTFAVPLPPTAEQQRIVAEAERRLSVVEEIEGLVNANLQRAIRLRQAILQRAFEAN